MKILVTGAEGMVARAVARVCAGLGDEVAALAKRELDITDRDAVSRVMIEGGFDTVINCAAYTDVDGAESNPDLCFAVNAEGVENLAKACRDADSVFVTISTDYVFDGSKEGFYDESDEPAPQSVYAAAKLEGEKLAAASYARSIIVRSGWIFGPGGTNFLSVMPDLLSDRKKITAIEDSFGTPTYAVDLAGRLRELAVSGSEGVFHVVNSGEGTSYLGFAKEICSAGGFDDALVAPVSSADLERAAPRPSNSQLGTIRGGILGPLPDWRDAVKRYLTRD
ncbi:MAG: dTDP-4-dehydrorhamnose reductase [Acidobacteriota bacterium]|nr:MAG: dTDP-4-dehydrorhamnose reductase [Acidobacteriota bacterium]